MAEYEHIIHTFEPVYDKNSKVLILGSLPSVKSREQGFYYGHPRNRFWAVIAAVAGQNVPVTIPEKRAMLLRSGIAVWDVVAECDIKGSSDASIKNVAAADLSVILENCDIKAIFANGSTAAKLYERFQHAKTGREISTLPSTSPANAAYGLERLTDEWRKKLGGLL